MNRKPADFLQNLGTAGKYVQQLVAIIKEKFGGGSSGKFYGSSRQLGYRE